LARSWHFRHLALPAYAAAVCRFPSVDAACEAAIAAIQSGIQMARVELLDEMPDFSGGPPKACISVYTKFRGPLDNSTQTLPNVDFSQDEQS
jgi:hypothetical protein